jgi:hypothetical protein
LIHYSRFVPGATAALLRTRPVQVMEQGVSVFRDTNGTGQPVLLTAQLSATPTEPQSAAMPADAMLGTSGTELVALQAAAM